MIYTMMVYSMVTVAVLAGLFGLFAVVGLTYMAWNGIQQLPRMLRLSNPGPAGR